MRKKKRRRKEKKEPVKFRTPKKLCQSQACPACGDGKRDSLGLAAKKRRGTRKKYPTGGELGKPLPYRNHANEEDQHKKEKRRRRH